MYVAWMDWRVWFGECHRHGCDDGDDALIGVEHRACLINYMYIQYLIVYWKFVDAISAC